MPAGYDIVDARTVRGPDGEEYDVLDAIQALPWRAQLCPLMRHEYTIWRQGPAWAWDVLGSMLLARNPNSFRAFFRGYQSANRYWDAPDGLRYWRGNKFEIDRGQPDDAGQRRVDAGARAVKDWSGPPHAPDGMGLYEQDEKGRWWPTAAALDAGLQPCASCEGTNKKQAIVMTPSDPYRVADVIAAAEEESRAAHGRPLSRDEQEQLLRWYPDRMREPSSPDYDSRTEMVAVRIDSLIARPKEKAEMAERTVPKSEVVRKLLELRAREAPLGSRAYRGVLTQKAIAEVAGVAMSEVTRAAIELDRELKSAEPPS